MTRLKILKKDHLAFLANMRHLLNAIGEYDPSTKEWTVETLGGRLDIYLPGDMGYTVFSQFRDTPTDAIPGWLYSKHSHKCNWHLREVSSEDIALRGWINPFIEVASNLALMVKGEKDAQKAIAKSGVLEDLLPSKGHVQFNSKDGGRQKTTVAMFRKQYRSSLCDHAQLYFDNTVGMSGSIVCDLSLKKQELHLLPAD